MGRARCRSQMRLAQLLEKRLQLGITFLPRAGGSGCNTSARRSSGEPPPRSPPRRARGSSSWSRRRWSPPVVLLELDGTRGPGVPGKGVFDTPAATGRPPDRCPGSVPEPAPVRWPGLVATLSPVQPFSVRTPGPRFPCLPYLHPGRSSFPKPASKAGAHFLPSRIGTLS